MLKEAVSKWTVHDSSDLYGVEHWGKGYFTVGDRGNVLVHPDRQADHAIDIKELVDRLQMRGLDLPILLRFNGVLHDRLVSIHDAFAKAIEDHDYQGKYCCVYPVKVNQQRQVVERIVEYGRPYGFGLEAGSKPELFAVVALTDADTPIVCNGFKDPEFVEMAMLAQKIGRRVIPVVEKYTDLAHILDFAEKVGVRPQIGMRVKLATRGAGRWQSSAGYRSKFGLTVVEILRAVEELERRGMSDCFKLLHFHLGSQVTNIRFIKTALVEAARIYADLVKRGTGLEYLDVGGGLGVDYDGSQTNFDSSANYTLQEYANDVVFHLQVTCDDAGIPHANIMSESGRAVAAYHSVLLFNVLGVSCQAGGHEFPQKLDDEVELPLTTLMETYDLLTQRNMLESFHDAQQSLEMAMGLFVSGYLSLEQRGIAETLFWAICRKIHKLVGESERVPEELEGLDRILAETYFCNFSLFQSMPDSWAIKQLFPVMPIHRLDQEPTHHAVLGDITCDSDGKIDQFVNVRDMKRTLLLHALDDSEYVLGAFLVGAYQEILGDLHNLFGDTNAVHVDLGENNEVVIDVILKGDSVSDVLQYVAYDDADLTHRLQTAVESAVQTGRLDHAEAGRVVKFYEAALQSYTYLESGEE